MSNLEILLSIAVILFWLYGYIFWKNQTTKHFKNMEKHWLKELKQAEETELELLRQLLIEKNKNKQNKEL